MDSLPPVALDFETFYDANVNVKKLGNMCYAARADAYLVSIYDGGEIQYVGPVATAPWAQIDGRHWIAHNASFEAAVFAANQIKGLIPKDVKPSHWDCTADLCAFLGIGRNLEDACRNAFGVILDKNVRKKMKGRSFTDLTGLETTEAVSYNFRDGQNCWNLWPKSAAWPIEEREFARVIRTRANAGIAVDQALLEDYQTRLTELREIALAKIPWGGVAPVLSLKSVKEFCVSQGIVSPGSLAEDSEDCALWERTYGEQYPIIAALRTYRKTNMYLRKLEAIRARIMPNGRMCFGLKYYGGHTGRLAGADGLNLQNLPRTEFEGMEFRHLLCAEPGKKLLIADFKQIEPVVVTWLSGNRGLLTALRAGVNLYEADAEQSGVWYGERGTFKKNFPLAYQTQKAQSLGLGYGLGRRRFRKIAKSELGLDFSEDEAVRIIGEWHARNPHVRVHWQRLERGFLDSLAKGENHEIILPSGRPLRYFNLSREMGQPTACAQLNSGEWRYCQGYRLFENVCQAIARDCLRDKVLALESAGIAVLFTSHDEVVCEVPLDLNAEVIEEIMSASLEWAPDLPLAAEIVESPHYLKA